MFVIYSPLGNKYFIYTALQRDLLPLRPHCGGGLRPIFQPGMGDLEAETITTRPTHHILYTGNITFDPREQKKFLTKVTFNSNCFRLRT